MVDYIASLLNCMPIDRASGSMMAWTKAIHLTYFGPKISSVAWSTGAQLMIFFCFKFSVVLFEGLCTSSRLINVVSIKSSSLLLRSIKPWVICKPGWWRARGLPCEPNNQLNVLYHIRHWRLGWAHKINLSAPVIHYWPKQGGRSSSRL